MSFCHKYHHPSNYNRRESIWYSNVSELIVTNYLVYFNRTPLKYSTRKIQIFINNCYSHYSMIKCIQMKETSYNKKGYIWFRQSDAFLCFGIGIRVQQLLNQMLFFYLYNKVNIIINNSNITTKLCLFVISITTLLIIIEGKASDIQMYPN